MKKIYDLIIIGGGPAGITAGIYGARQKLNTLLITKIFGGQVARKALNIENYPGFEEISGLELIQRFEKHLRKFTPLDSKHLTGQVDPVRDFKNRKKAQRGQIFNGVDIERDEVIKLKKIGEKFSVLTKSKNQFQAKAIIVASGADPRPLEVPGEKKFISHGVSYCAICDGPLFSDKTVAVIGGGNSAFETAVFLSNFVKKIYILEAGLKIRADAENQERIKKTGKVEVITNVVLKKIKGKEFVDAIVYQDYNPPATPDNPKIKKLAVDGIFVEIGSQPSTSFAKGLVDFNEKDEIKVDFESFQTKTPGLFAAGDVNVGKYKQIITAAGEGAKAALAAYDYLQKQR